MDYFILFIISYVIALIYSTNLTQHAANAVHFFIRQGYKQGLFSLIFLALIEAGIATIAGIVLYLFIQIHLNPYTVSIIGAGILLLLLIVHYKKQKLTENPENLPSNISSMGKHYFQELCATPSRYLGYFALFATLIPFSYTSPPLLLSIIPIGIFLGSLSFWWGFQTYIYFHPELLIRRKLNTMQNTSHYLIIIFILFGIFHIL